MNRSTRRTPLPRTLNREMNTQIARYAHVDIARMDQLGILYGTLPDTGQIVMSIRDWARAERGGGVDVISLARTPAQQPQFTTTSSLP